MKYKYRLQGNGKIQCITQAGKLEIQSMVFQTEYPYGKEEVQVASSPSFTSSLVYIQSTHNASPQLVARVSLKGGGLKLCWTFGYSCMTFGPQVEPLLPGGLDTTLLGFEFCLSMVFLG